MSNRLAAAPNLPVAGLSPGRVATPVSPNHRDRASHQTGHDLAGRKTQEDIVVDQTCSPAEQAAAISAFKNGASVNAVASMLGKTPGSVEWLLKKNGLKKNGLKKNDHKKPAPDEQGDRAKKFVTNR
jgi:hypothetical protein